MKEEPSLKRKRTESEDVKAEEMGTAGQLEEGEEAPAPKKAKTE